MAGGHEAKVPEPEFELLDTGVFDDDRYFDVFAEYAKAPDSGVLFTEEQSVSSDMIGEPYAVIIEGSETHARTGFTRVNLAELGLPELAPEHEPAFHRRLP